MAPRQTFDIVSLLAMTLRMFVTSISVKSAAVGGNAAAAGFTADTDGAGGGVGLAAGGKSTGRVTGVRFLALM